MKERVLVTGTIPPPIGGVTIFVRRFLSAAKLYSDVDVKLFDVVCFFLGAYDCLLVNSSNKYKRLFFILFARAYGKKVYFVKHGGVFDLGCPFIKASLKLSHGVFCLNDKVLEQVRSVGVRSVKITSIFEENKREIIEYKEPGQNFELGKIGRPVVLFYVYNDSSVQGKEVYGARFFRSALDLVGERIFSIVVDLSGAYAALYEGDPNVLYIRGGVDFVYLLRRVDVYVRPTSTDGSSVALLEAGLLGVKCLASDVVDRPGFVTTYKYGDLEDFVSELLDLLRQEKASNNIQLTSMLSVFEFMGALLPKYR